MIYSLEYAVVTPIQKSKSSSALCIAKYNLYSISVLPVLECVNLGGDARCLLIPQINS